MWCVLNRKGDVVAYMMEEYEAVCFMEVFYQGGRVVFRAITVIETEE
jgi:hypothetical protein